MGLYWKQLGESGPSVIFEAGFAASHLSWMGLAPEVAKFARVFVYDRAGYGYSDPSPEPRTGEQCVAELHSLAHSAGWPAPYILVGHSFGALIIRLFAERWPGEVAGIVMVDPILLREWWPPTAASRKRIRLGTRLFGALAALARMGVLSPGIRLMTYLRTRGRGPSSPAFEQLLGELRKLPEWTWPIVRRHWSRPASFATMRRYLESLEESCRTGSELRSLGDIPLVTISGAHLSEDQRAEHTQLAALSARSVHLSATQGRHWIQLDEPELVLRAIQGLCGDTWPELIARP